MNPYMLKEELSYGLNHDILLAGYQMAILENQSTTKKMQSLPCFVDGRTDM